MNNSGLSAKSKINYPIVILINFIFFESGLVASVIGAIIPDIIVTYNLGYGIAGVLLFSYFIAYGVVAIPAGWLGERTSVKTVILLALAVGFLGTFLFALFPVYAIALLSLFLIGCCLAAAQVNLMPLLRVAVGGENLAFYTLFMTLLFGLGSFISPHIYSYFVNHLFTDGTNNNLILHFLEKQLSPETKWVAVYWVSSAALLLTLIVISFIQFPQIKLEENEKTGTRSSYIQLLKDKRVVLFFLAIFFYVFCEQGVANWMSQFLKTYHNVSPQTTGAFTLSYYWILLTVGCSLGMFLVKFFDSRKIMSVAASLALIALFASLWGGKDISIIAFALIGLFISVLWPISMELAFNTVDYHHGSFSGILFTGTIGGAVGPLLVGAAGDYIGLRLGMLLVAVPLFYLLFISFWTKPRVKNRTLKMMKTKVASS
ncbi:MAG: hypothetical protein A2W90_08980 [Bacteroidetes bacterium GWF2_42_66]|nr:MAG: hypothetical protein A2W92_17225 [Bacteroidetes bacterium GWA2_42_15]OFX97122.1 MAG: hypothetical protein A2W89_00105 [Bacteroidetes bacterium GWE2_42_39]OFY46193.1 MAG: hypothetical protein A2W90_08980 [Bacteroidetes bacterium GWF2_42_66]HBL78040.1 MFS transporter [Prolixibacteraceae bacterium]HCR92060.1 MFS transporter [Prolixibacteraceae bacterium]